MKLYAYRRIGKIEFETCELPPEAHVQQIGTVEVTEPGKETATKTVWVNAYKDKSHVTELYGTKADAIANRDRSLLAGWLGAFPCEIIEPPKPKQTVTKENRQAMRMREMVPEKDTGRVLFYDIPLSAKNIRCFYDLEE